MSLQKKRTRQVVKGVRIACTKDHGLLYDIIGVQHQQGLSRLSEVGPVHASRRLNQSHAVDFAILECSSAPAPGFPGVPVFQLAVACY
jgi:hypothetical protein